MLKYKDCGCEETKICGCVNPTDFKCVGYSGDLLQPLNIQEGMNGEEIIKIINEYLNNLKNQIEIENVGEGAYLYKGVTPDGVHQIKSLIAGTGVIIKETADGVTITVGDSVGALYRDVVSNVTEGNIQAGQRIPTGTDLQTFVELFLLKTFYPELINPSASLSIDDSDKELGSAYSFTGTLNFDRGIIKGNNIHGVWDPNATQNPRSGLATNYNIQGVDLGLTNNRVLSGTTTLGSNSFSGYVDYANASSTLQPLDSTGANYDSPLLAGRVNTSNSFQGKYRIFYGASGDNVTDFRSLPQNQLIAGSTSFTINTGTSNKSFYIVIPDTNSLQEATDQDALNANVKSSFVLLPTNQVPDAGGTPRAYKVYRWTNAEPFPMNHRINIKI